MKKFIKGLVLSVFVMLSGYAVAQDESQVADSVNQYQGTYIGTEVLNGGTAAGPGTYTLTFVIDASGKIEVIDVDNVSAHGKLKGNSFVINRALPPQIFKGTVSEGVISGKTWGNPYVGGGTFSAKFQ